MNPAAKPNTFVRNVCASCSAAVFLYVSWWLAWKVGANDYFPSPFSVLSTAYHIVVSGEFFTHFIATMSRIAIGFCIAFLAAPAIALCMRNEGWLREFIRVQVTVALTVPSLAWSVIGIVLFGLHDGAAIFTVLATTLPVMATTLDQGVRAMDGDLLEMGRTYKLPERQVFRSIVIPQLLPHLFGAARYGLSLSWKTVIITEMLGLGSGLGYQISYYFGLLSLMHVLAWTLVFTAAMLLIEYGVIQKIEAWLFRWRPQYSSP